MAPTFMDEIQAARLRSARSPICVPCHIPVSGPCSAPEPPLGDCPPAHSHPPSIPLAFRPSLRPRLLPENYTPTSVEVFHPLQRGPKSQVYRARVTSLGSSVRPNVVLKLYQSSLLDPGTISDYCHVYASAEGLGWGCSSNLAQREAWAYQTLKIFQGGSLPHSYGFYMFRVPSGEEVVGHIMEQIHGMSVFEYGQSIGRSRIEIHKLGEAIFWAVASVHSAGVLHGDLLENNQSNLGNLMIQTQGEALSVVLLDFAESDWLLDVSGTCSIVDAIGLRELLFASTASFSWQLLETNEERKLRHLWINEWARQGGRPWSETFRDLWEYEGSVALNRK